VTGAAREARYDKRSTMRTFTVSHPLAPAAAVRRLATAASALLTAGVLSLALVAGADAHQTMTVMPNDGSFAVMYINHDTLAVCDEQVDGHYAYLRRTDIWGNVLPTVYDPDGAGGACGYVAVPNAFGLSSYNVCVQYEGCGIPVYQQQF
jgi:hypothetical protein